MNNSKIIVINSLGKGGADLIPQLQHGFNIPEQVVAQKLYQAPSILASAVSAEVADQVVEVLRSTGVNAESLPDDAQFEAGKPDFEIAITIQSFKEIDQIFERTNTIFGITESEFRKIICRTPSVLLGSVSEDTANIVKERFSDLPVVIDIVNTKESKFDLIIQFETFSDTSSVETKFLKKLEDMSVSHTENTISRNQKVIATRDLTYAQAGDLWSFCQGNSLNCMLLNQAYQKFELVLAGVTNEADTGKIETYLSSEFGIPEKVAPKLIANTPVTIAKNLDLLTSHNHLANLNKLGAEVLADMVSTMTFEIEVSKSENFDEEVFMAVIPGVFGTTDLELTKLKNTIESVGSAKVAAKLNYNWAMWAKSELDRAGIQSRLIKQQGDASGAR